MPMWEQNHYSPWYFLGDNFWDVVTTIALESVEHSYKFFFPTFSFATFGDKLIFLSLETTFGRE
jgi:hypothetical protein